jgi:hypothetical protein
MTREEAEFISKLCNNSSVTWIKTHIEYQKKFVDPSQWHEDTSGYQKGTALPHGSQIEGNDLCKRAQAFKN